MGALLLLYTRSDDRRVTRVVGPRARDPPAPVGSGPVRVGVFVCGVVPSAISQSGVPASKQRGLPSLPCLLASLDDDGVVWGGRCHPNRHPRNSHHGTGRTWRSTRIDRGRPDPRCLLRRAWRAAAHRWPGSCVVLSASDDSPRRRRRRAGHTSCPTAAALDSGWVHWIGLGPSLQPRNSLTPVPQINSHGRRRAPACGEGEGCRRRR